MTRLRFAVLGVLAACGTSPTEPRALANTEQAAAPTATGTLVAALRSATIQVATMRPPGATTALLERRVLIVGPAEAKQLAALGDPAILDALLPLLDDPERAWAAQVLLAKLTQTDEKTVDIYMTNPTEWWTTVGPTARKTWTRWLADHRARLTWDAAQGAFLSLAP